MVTKMGNLISRFSATLGIVAAVMIVAMVVIIVYEVIVRYVFVSPTWWAIGTAAYLLAGVVLFGSCYTLMIDEHVRVTMLVSRLRARYQGLMYALGLACSLPFVGVLCWQGWRFFWESYRLQWETVLVLGLPAWVTTWVVPVGAFFLILQMIVQIYRYIKK